ncbi:MAG: CHASE2 domain-containing protein [Desulfobacca sp.]|uniref:CHASE2 domain-containing protein n=1 Tax=Desulfobacca sp. TaxID=2067990 RepID=UPI00404ABE9C
MRKYFALLLRPTYLTATILVLLLHLLLMTVHPRFIHNLEMNFYDLMFQLRGPLPVGPEVVIVAIDDASVKAIGRWPWSRREIIRLLEALTGAGAKVIGFDIIFAEKEEGQDLALLARLQQELRRLGRQVPELQRWLQQERQLLDPDVRLAALFKQHGNVVLGYYFQGLASVSSGPESFGLAIAKDMLKSSTYDVVRWTSTYCSPCPLVTAWGVETNLPRLTAAAADTGFFNAMPDPDGAIRAVPLVVSYQDDLYAPLSLAILQKYLGDPPLQITLGDHGIVQLAVGSIRLPVDDYGYLRLNFRGPAKTFPYYSLVDVVSGQVPPERFKDKIVLVGASAVGIYDVRVTPFAAIFPGVEVHANAIDNILRGDFLWAPTGLVNPAALVLMVLALTMCWLQPRVRPWFGLLSLGLMITLTLWVNFYLFSRHQIYLQTTYVLSGLSMTYVLLAFLRFLAEERERKRIRAAFQNYVAPEVVNTMLQHPEKLKLGGEKREMTVLFSDIRGFTTLSERLEPEVLVNLLQSYLNPMTEVVFQHHGTMDKYIGDAIMAIYGAPLPLPDHAARACDTALDMLTTLTHLWEDWRAQGLPALKIGIGINSGPMTVGNMGSERLFDYTVIGDNVNLASRLEGLNKYYGTAILISEATQQLLPDTFLLREVDRVRVKGKKASVAIFELRGRGQPTGLEAALLQSFAAGLTAFRQLQWQKAEEHFRRCLDLYPDDGPAKLLLQRTAQLAQQPPPPDWDGTTTLTEK